MSGRVKNSIVCIKLGVLLLAVLLYYCLPGVQDFLRIGLGFLQRHDFAGLRLFILAYGFWAPVISIILMAMQSMVPLVPGLVITITNALIFGWEYGAVYSWIGALLGASLDFGIARWYGRPCVEKIISSRYLDLTDGFFRRHGVLAVLISRLTPIIPFKAVSYGAGLTAISAGQFIIATAVGQTPAIVLYSILAHSMTHSIFSAIVTTLLLVACGVVAYYYRSALHRYFFPTKNS